MSDSRITSGWRRVAIFNPANGERVTLSTLYPDGSSWSHTQRTAQSATGRGYVSSSFSCSIAFSEPAGIQKLNDWMYNNIGVQFVIEGEDSLVGWYEPCVPLVTRVTNSNARNGVERYIVSFQHTGYRPFITTGRNLMQFLRNGWYRFAPAGQYASALEGAANVISPSFNNATLTQFMSLESTIPIQFVVYIPFPLSGVTARLGMQTASGAVLDDSNLVALRSNSFGHTPLLSATGTFSPFGTLQVGPTGATHYEFEVQLDLQVSAGGPFVTQMIQPYLRLDGINAFTTF